MTLETLLKILEKHVEPWVSMAPHAYLREHHKFLEHFKENGNLQEAWIHSADGSWMELIMNQFKLYDLVPEELEKFCRVRKLASRWEWTFPTCKKLNIKHSMLDESRRRFVANTALPFSVVMEHFASEFSS